jgi:hypothetical protein
MQIKDLIPEEKTVWNLPDSGKSLYEILENDCDEPKISIGDEPKISMSVEPKISTEPDVKTNSHAQNHAFESRICVTNYETDFMMEHDIEMPDPVFLYNDIQAEEESEKSKKLNFVDERNTHTSVRSDDVSMETEESEKKCLDLVLADSGMNGNLEFSELSEMPLSASFVAVESNTNSSVTNNELHDEAAVENVMGVDEDISTDGSNSRASSSGKARVKRRTPHGVSLFPFKRFLSPDSLKKKAKKAKRKL